jgi:hypothetical protein
MLHTFLLLQFPFFGLLVCILAYRLYRKKTILKRAVIVLGVYFLLLALILFPYRARIKKQLLGYKNAMIQRVAPRNYCSCQNMALPKDDYASAHRVGAIRVTKNGFILNDKVLQQKIRAGKLIQAQESDGYWIQNAQNGTKYLTPLANQRLIELGKRFRAKIAHTANSRDYFVISSITRTEAQQEVIRKRYPNQATKGSSTHSFGVSFDIAELSTKADCKVGYAALTAALSQMQQEGKILLCPESTCMHVTVVR